jgi:hypothetical protein
MRQRGRKSAAELSVIVSPLAARRPAPPTELTAEQSEEWRAIVSRMPPDWFTRERFALLDQYCRHVCRARLMAKQIDDFDLEWLKDEAGPGRLDKFMAMAERETRALNALARSMRLTHQSRLKAETAASKVGARSQVHSS